MQIFKSAIISAAVIGAGIAGVQALSLSMSAPADLNISEARRGTAPTDAGRPVAVELFTSQGCSSCPPADKVSGKFARNDDIVMITRPVTYWNRLGWKDTLARSGNDDLQRSYARRGFDTGGVYTPQMVINGAHGLVGSNEGKALTKVQQARTPVRVAAAKAKAGEKAVFLSGPKSGSAAVTLVALKSSTNVKIGRGENGGRTVTYYNVLVDETNIGNWNGGTKLVAYKPALTTRRGADRYAVIVRDTGDGTDSGIVVYFLSFLFGGRTV